MYICIRVHWQCHWLEVGSGRQNFAQSFHRPKFSATSAKRPARKPCIARQQRLLCAHRGSQRCRTLNLTARWPSARRSHRWRLPPMMAKILLASLRRSGYDPSLTQNSQHHMANSGPDFRLLDWFPPPACLSHPFPSARRRFKSQHPSGKLFKHMICAAVSISFS